MLKVVLIIYLSIALLSYIDNVKILVIRKLSVAQCVNCNVNTWLYWFVVNFGTVKPLNFFLCTPLLGVCLSPTLHWEFWVIWSWGQGWQRETVCKLSSVSIYSVSSIAHFSIFFTLLVCIFQFFEIGNPTIFYRHQLYGDQGVHIW